MAIDKFTATQLDHRNIVRKALKHVVGQNTTLEVWCCLEETYLQATKEREV